MENSLTPQEEEKNTNEISNVTDENEIKLYARKVLDDVNLFYKKLYLHTRQKDNIKKLCSDIDEVSSNLKTITKLEQCKELETSFCDGANVNEAKRRHEERLKQINSKWWEKLDIYEVA